MEEKEVEQLPKREMIGFQEMRFSSSTQTEKPSKVCNFTALYLHGLLGSGDELRDFSNSLASSLSKFSVSDWRMILVDLRNHGSSVDREGLSPPHNMVNTARDVANLFKSLNWAQPDVVIGHSVDGKVALQYALSCSQGDYGDSSQFPKQLWILDAVPGIVKNNTLSEQLGKALQSLAKLPSKIPSREWLVDHIDNLGISKYLSEWLGNLLKKSGEHETFTFNADGALQMLRSFWDMDYWAFLEQLPKGMEVAFARVEKWDTDVVERLENLAARENDESIGKVSVHVVPNSGHFIHKDQPGRLLEIMTPKIASLVQEKS